MLRTLGDLVLEGTSLHRPKPLLLLAYLVLEGSTPRRRLSELFFGDTKDPNDGLTTALKYLKQHPSTMLEVGPNIVATGVGCDVTLVFAKLKHGLVAEAASLYQGAFLATLKLNLGEELEDWVYTQQDLIAQRFRLTLMNHVETQTDPRKMVSFVEHIWHVTKEQEIDTDTLGRLYRLLDASGSSLTHEVSKQAAEYGIPLVRHSSAAREASQGPQGTARNVVPAYVPSLVQQLERLRESPEGLALCIWGAPGIGKTWTVERLKDTLSFPVYSVMAAVSPAQLPRSLPRAAGLPAWARTVLGNLQDDRLTGGQELVDAVAAILAAHAPVVLHVEDFHEASELAQTLWSALALSVQRSPGVGLLVTSRQPSPAGFTPDPLPALTRAEIARVLEHVTGAALPAEATDWIEDRALGNPLFALEFYRYLRKRGNLWHDGSSWRWRVPTSTHLPDKLETLVSHMFQELALEEGANTFVQLKALLPTGTSEQLLAQIAGLSDKEIQGVKNTLKQQGILGEQDFVHPLYREVLVAGLNRPTKRELARRIVTVLEEANPEQAAPFVADAGLTDQRAVKLLLRAADHARLRGLTRQAGELLSRAAGHTQGRQRSELLLQAANALQDNQPAQTQRLAERVLEAEPANVEATLLLARCLVVQGEGERADAVMQRLPQTVRPRQAWLEQLIHLRTERNDYAGVIELWQGAADLHGTLDPSAKRDVALSLVYLGKLDEAARLLTQTLATPGVPDEAHAALLEVRATLAFYTGNYAEALALLDESVALLRAAPKTLPLLNRLFQALRVRAMCYWGLGENRLAIGDTEEAMSFAGELGSGRDYAIAQTYIGVPLTELGAFARAEEMLLESREVLRRADAREHLAACEAMLSHVYMEWQPQDAAIKALRHAHTSVEIARELQAPVLLSQATFYASWVETTFGQGEKALALAQESLELATNLGQQRNVAIGLWARGRALEKLGQPDRALADYLKGEGLCRGLHFLTYAALIGLEIDRLKDDENAARVRLEYLSARGVRSMMLSAREHFAALFGEFGSLRLDP